MPFHGTHVFFSYSRKDDEPKDATGKGWVERFWVQRNVKRSSW